MTRTIPVPAATAPIPSAPAAASRRCSRSAACAAPSRTTGPSTRRRRSRAPAGLYPRWPLSSWPLKSPTQWNSMAQYVFTMNRVGKVVPPKKQILKDISLSFFPGAKIGVLGLNGAGKSTLLRIMAGVDTEFEGEARPMPGINVGYLPQEPELDDDKNVRETVEEALGAIKEAQEKLDAVYATYAEADADYEALAAEQARLENIIDAPDDHNLEPTLEAAAEPTSSLRSRWWASAASTW